MRIFNPKMILLNICGQRKESNDKVCYLNNIQFLDSYEVLDTHVIF
jgi:hypothetical protein